MICLHAELPGLLVVDIDLNHLVIRVGVQHHSWLLEDLNFGIGPDWILLHGFLGVVETVRPSPLAQSLLLLRIVFVVGDDHGVLRNVSLRNVSLVGDLNEVLLIRKEVSEILTNLIVVLDFYRKVDERHIWSLEPVGESSPVVALIVGLGAGWNYVPGGSGGGPPSGCRGLGETWSRGSIDWNKMTMKFL